MEERDFFITGIQQVGVGTTSVYDSWKWFIKMFGVDIRVLEDDTVAERMLPNTGGHPRKRHAAIAINLQGGGTLDLRTSTYADFASYPIQKDHIYTIYGVLSRYNNGWQLSSGNI